MTNRIAALKEAQWARTHHRARRAPVAVIGGVRELANAHAVQYDQNRFLAHPIPS